MQKHTTISPAATIGIDVGHRISQVAIIDSRGEWLELGTIRTTRRAYQHAFSS